MKGQIVEVGIGHKFEDEEIKCVICTPYNPLISILIPFKNTAEFLAECLQSIINQNYTNWELLIVDDDSTDDSYNIVEEFAVSNSRASFINFIICLFLI